MNKKIGYKNQGLVLAQFGGKCFGCGKTQHQAQLEFAHRIAESLGGTLDTENLMIECRECNNFRQDKSDAQAYGLVGAERVLLAKQTTPTAAEIASALYEHASIIIEQATANSRPIPLSVQRYIGSKLHRQATA